MPTTASSPWQHSGEPLESLLRLLKRAEGFSLAFLRCNVVVERERIVIDLIEALKSGGRHGRVLRLEEKVVDLRAEIAGLSPPLAAGEVLFVLGLERSIPSEGPTPTLHQLNMARELFRRFPCPLVVVLPEYALTRLAREAPDFWAWRSGVFEVAIEAGRLQELHREMSETWDSVANLSAERKHERLAVLQELLRKYPENTHTTELARIIFEIADLRHLLGEYEQALKGYQKALQIFEGLGERDGMAAAYHHLGSLAQQRGDYEQALEWYREALQIAEELGNRAGMASTSHQLGMVAQQRGDYEQALEWYRKSLEVKEELGNRAGMASCYHQLGRVAQQREDFEQVLGWYRKALQIDEELGNRAGMASSYHQIGTVAQRRGNYEQALEWYQTALQIFEELGNLAGMAISLGQIGALLTESGEPGQAIPFTLHSLAIHTELKSPNVRINLHWLRRQREQLGDERFRAILSEHLDADALTAVWKMLEELPKGAAEEPESQGTSTSSS